MDNYLNSFREMISLRGLTDHTLKNYCTYIRAYLDYLSTFLHKQWDDTQLPMRRFDEYLPFVPSKQKVSILIDSMPDLKQKAMVALMYSSGLRIGEVCHLRYEDIQRKNMRIHIRHGKNRSDRYAILSKRALDILTAYWFAFGKPVGWLFPKQHDSSKPIDTFYLSRHIHEVERSLGWEQRITCHSLRHAFGTHLYEDGVGLLTIKALLGHKSINSTTIYVHLASNGTSDAVSPFDLMGGGHAQ